MQQPVEITAVQGQSIDGLVADGPAQGGIGSIDRRNLSSDRDRLGLLAGLNDQINANILSHLDQHAGVFHCPEPFGFRADRVRAGSEIVGYVLPGAIRSQSSRDAASDVDHTHDSAGDGATSLVKNAPLNGALTGL